MSHLDRFSRRLQALPHTPRLRPGYKLIELAPDHYLLHSGIRSVDIRQPFPGLPLIPFLEQISGHQALVSLLEPLPPFQAAFFLDVLEVLNQTGLLVSAPENGENGASARYASQALFFDHLRQFSSNGDAHEFLEVKEWQARLSQASVGLVGLGRVGSQLARLLAISGVGAITGVDEGVIDDALLYTDAWYGREEAGAQRTAALARRLSGLNSEMRFTPLARSLSEEDSLPTQLLDLDLLVVTLDQPCPGLYEAINRQCIEAGLPWTSYRMSWTGLAVEIGPTVYPRQTACYLCYQTRRRSNLASPERDEAIAQALGRHSLPLLDLQLTPGVSLLAYEIIRFLSGQVLPRTWNAIFDFNLLTSELIRRPLLKLPRCPACRRDVNEFAPARFWADLYAEGSLPAVGKQNPIDP